MAASKIKKLFLIPVAFWPFAVLWAVFFVPLLTLRDSFIVADYMVQHLPWAKAMYACVREGRLPFWTPLMGGGFPLFAEGQIAALYLPQWLAYRALPFMAAYTWSIPFHFAVGGIGMFAYVRRLGSSPAAAGWAAACFAFGSGYAGCFSNTASLRTACWIPLVLWIFEWARRRPSVRWPAYAAAALIVSQQWVAGASQIAVYTFGYYVLHESVLLWNRRRECFGPELWAAWTGVIGAILLGSWMALPQIFPSMELIQHSIRPGEGASFALWGSVPPVAPLSLMFPAWGNALGYCFYVGIAPLFLILFLVICRRSEPVVRHVWLTVLFFLLALGRFNPLYALAVEHLHLTLLRNPAKFLFFSVTSLSVLAGFGWDALMEARAEKVLSKRLKKIAVRLAAVAVLMPAAAFGLTVLARPFWGVYSHWYVGRLVAEKGALAKDPAYYMDVMKKFMDSLEKLFSYQNRMNLEVLFLALAAAVLIALFLDGRLKKRFFTVLMSAVLVWDFFVFAHFMGTGFIGNSGPVERLRESPWTSAVRAELGRDSGPETPKIAEIVAAQSDQPLTPNFQMYYGMAHAGGYSPLLIKKYHELIYDLGISDASLGMPPVDGDVWHRERGIVDLIGARFLIADNKLDWEGLREVRSDGARLLYRNDKAMPLMWMAGGTKVILNSGERIRYLKSADFDPRETVVLEAEKTAPESAPGSQPASTPKINSIHSDASGVRVQAKARGPGLAATRMTEYPGWQLRVDGKPQAIQRVNHAFMGFWIGPGSHEIVLEYQPTNWALWTGLSMAGWMAWGLACIIGLLRWKTRGTDKL